MGKRVLLVANLGSPATPGVKDVHRYLNEFLMDERVIDLPYWRRLLLVKGIITPFRAPKSAAKYLGIWGPEGAPLIVLTQKMAAGLAAETGLPVYVCMRYGAPTPAEALRRLSTEHPDVDEVVLCPLYPHYAMSSYETAVEHVQTAYNKGKYAFDLKVVPPFYAYPAYIEELAASLQPFLSETDYDHVLFSYHGIPERHVRKSDPTGSHCLQRADCCSVRSSAHATCYRHQVRQTTELVAEKLGLPKHSYSLSYQSRLGSDKWLSPATSDELAALPGRGIKRLLVLSPAFMIDCLETLEELHDEGRETFMEAGGQLYDVVPCLNERAWKVLPLKELGGTF